MYDITPTFKFYLVTPLIATSCIYLKFSRLGHQHSLKHLREIPKVKGVVRLGRSGEELSHDGGVNCVCCTDQLGD